MDKKPAVIKEHGEPRYVVLDWKTYQEWEEALYDAGDAKRLFEALNDSANQKRVKVADLKF